MFQIKMLGNSKTAIPTTRSARSTCPTSCPLMGAGCYAENFPMAMEWDKLTVRGLSYADLLDEISRLKRGTLWRHNDAGDLIGSGNRINLTALVALVDANRGRRGFTYTHWDWWKNRNEIRWANLHGFTINVSTESHADAKAAYIEGLPVALVADQVGAVEDRDGIRYVVCPAQTKGWTCKDCGLCAVADREYVIVFRPHGTKKKALIKLLNLDDAEAVAEGTALFNALEETFN